MLMKEPSRKGGSYASGHFKEHNTPIRFVLSYDFLNEFSSSSK